MRRADRFLTFLLTKGISSTAEASKAHVIEFYKIVGESLRTKMDYYYAIRASDILHFEVPRP